MKVYKRSKAQLILHALLILLGIGLITFPIVLIAYLTNYITLQEKTIEGRTGVFKKQTMHSKINDHMSIKVEQGIFGRLFNYGDIAISIPAGQYIFKKMNDPCKVRKEILNNEVIQAANIYQTIKKTKLIIELVKKLHKKIELISRSIGSTTRYQTDITSIYLKANQGDQLYKLMNKIFIDYIEIIPKKAKKIKNFNSLDTKISKEFF